MISYLFFFFWSIMLGCSYKGYKMVLRGFTKEIIGSEGVLVHNFKNELVLATTSWILHPEYKFFVPGRNTALSCTFLTESLMPN